MKKLIFGVATGFALVLGPCAVAQEHKPESAATATSAASPKVTLLDAGAEPRAELRYTPKVGATEKLTLRMKMSSESEANGQQLMSMAVPPMVMDMDMKVDEVRSNGDIAYSMTLSRADVEPGDSDPMMVNAMRAAMKGMVGMTGSVVINNRGETKEVDFKVPASADPNSRQMVESMKQSTRQMSTPLPAEPVGKGARWEVASSMETSGIKINQTNTMTLKDVSGSDFDVTVAVVQNAPKQALDLPGMPPGTNVELIGMKTEGTGTTKASTTSIVPRDVLMNMTTDQELRMSEGPNAQSQQMKQKVKIEMTMKGGTGSAAPAPKEPEGEAPKK